MELLDRIVEESRVAGYPVILIPIPGRQPAIISCAALPVYVLGMIDEYSGKHTKAEGH